MKKRIEFLSLLLILTFAILTQLPVRSASAVSLSRDLVVPGGVYQEILDERWDIDGNIIVEKAATLVLTNAFINIIGAERGHKITFSDATLIVQNATINGRTWFPINFQGASNVTAFRLNVNYGVLNFQGSTRAELTEFNYVEEPPFPQSYMTAQDSSVVTILNSTIMQPLIRKMAFSAKGSARVSIFDTQMRDLETRGTSQVSLVRTGLLWTINTNDFSKVAVFSALADWVTRVVPLATAGIVTAGSSSLAMNNTIMRRVDAYDSSSVSVFNTTIKDAAINAYNSSIVSLAKISMMGTATPPTIVAYQASKITIIDSEIKDRSVLGAYGTTEVAIQGSKLGGLGVVDQSEVTISDSQLSGLSFISGSASVSFSNSQLATIQAAGFSSLSVSDCEIETLESFDNSQVSVLDSEMAILRSSDSSDVTLEESSVEMIFLYFRSINASLSNLNPALYESWASLAVASIGADGYAPNVTLTRTTVGLCWSFWFFGCSNVTINDSTLGSIGASDTSTVWLTNSTLVSAPSAMSDGLVYVYWYLNVYSVGGASVSVLYSDGTLAESEVANIDGLARFTLLEKTVDSSGTNFVGNYKITATWDGSSAEATAELTNSMKLVVAPPVPWWQEFWYLIALVAVAVVLVASAAILVRRRGKKKLA